MLLRPAVAGPLAWSPLERRAACLLSHAVEAAEDAHAVEDGRQEGTCDKTSFEGCVSCPYCRSRLLNRKYGPKTSQKWQKTLKDVSRTPPNCRFWQTTEIAPLRLIRPQRIFPQSDRANEVLSHVSGRALARAA